MPRSATCGTHEGGERANKKRATCWTESHGHDHQMLAASLVAGLDTPTGSSRILPPAQLQHRPSRVPPGMLHSFHLTCCRDPGEDPALPVRDGLTIGRVVLPQDLHAAAPCRRRYPIRVIARPVAYQDAKVILGVYLRGATRLINQTRQIECFFARLLDLFHKFIWERVLSEGLL